MIKNIILFLIAFYALSTRAQGLRDVCENAYYATGYVKLHQYKLVIDWSTVSDGSLVELEDIIYGDQFVVINEQDLAGSTKTVFTLSEVESSDVVSLENDLLKLSLLSLNNINCLYNL